MKFINNKLDEQFVRYADSHTIDEDYLRDREYFLDLTELGVFFGSNTFRKEDIIDSDARSVTVELPLSIIDRNGEEDEFSTINLTIPKEFID